MCVCARACGETGYLYVPFHLLYSFLTLHWLQCDFMDGSATLYDIPTHHYKLYIWAFVKMCTSSLILIAFLVMMLLYLLFITLITVVLDKVVNKILL